MIFLVVAEFPLEENKQINTEIKMWLQIIIKKVQNTGRMYNVA
jgi:hypothetical protein